MDTLSRSSLPAPELDIAELLGPAAWLRLPPAVRHRFARAHAATAYEGALDLDCTAVGRCFGLFSRVFGGPLAARRCLGVPATVHVYGDGRGGVVWERHLHAGAGREHVVRSTKLPGPRGSVIERTDGGLAMELDVFEEEGRLVFLSRRYFLALGAWRLPIPVWLTPGTCRVEHRDEGAGRFRFTLSIDHPWWGRTVHQTGLFRDPEES